MTTSELIEDCLAHAIIYVEAAAIAGRAARAARYAPADRTLKRAKFDAGLHESNCLTRMLVRLRDLDEAEARRIRSDALARGAEAFTLGLDGAASKGAASKGAE